MAPLNKQLLFGIFCVLCVSVYYSESCEHYFHFSQPEVRLFKNVSTFPEGNKKIFLYSPEIVYYDYQHKNLDMNFTFEIITTTATAAQQKPFKITSFQNRNQVYCTNASLQIDKDDDGLIRIFWVNQKWNITAAADSLLNYQCRYKINAHLLSYDKSRDSYSCNNSSFLLVLNFTFLQNTHSHTIPLQEICFSGQKQITLTVQENAPQSTKLLNLTQMTHKKMRFTTNSSVLFVNGSIVQTGSKVKLDREALDLYWLEFTCHLETLTHHNYNNSNNHSNQSVAKSTQSTISIPAKLVILDLNDNLPYHQESGEKNDPVVVNISMASHKQNPGVRLKPLDYTVLLSTDLDSVGVNQNYKIHPYNDSLEILSFNLVLYTIPGFVFNTSAQTGVQLNIYFSENILYVAPFDVKYCVLVGISDNNAAPSVHFLICLKWEFGFSQGRPRPNQLVVASELLNRSELLQLLNPFVGFIRIGKGGNPLSHISSIFPNLVCDYTKAVAGVSFSIVKVYVESRQFANEEDEVQFMMMTMSHQNADNNNSSSSSRNVQSHNVLAAPTEYESLFQITPIMAQVYLVDGDLLARSMYNLVYLEIYCESSVIQPFHKNITILISTFLKPIVSTIATATQKKPTLCAKQTSQAVCERTFGYSASNNNGMCEWTVKPYQTCIPSSYFSSMYSPRCPDGRCDELERLYPGLCAQDCANSTDPHSKLSKLIKHDDYEYHGIGKCPGRAGGVVSCTNGYNCSCIIIKKDESESHRERFQTTTANTNSTTTVGPPPLLPQPPPPFFSTPSSPTNSYALLIIIVALVLLILIGVVILLVAFFFCRQTRQSAAVHPPTNTFPPPPPPSLPRRESIIPNQINEIVNEQQQTVDLQSFNATSLCVMRVRGNNNRNDDDAHIHGNQLLQQNFSKLPKGFQISSDQILSGDQPDSKLGEGYFGQVVKKRFLPKKDNDDDQISGSSPSLPVNAIDVAMKTIFDKKEWSSQAIWDNIFSEFRFLHDLRHHANIIGVYGIYLSQVGQKHLYIVMELAELGSLYDILRKYRSPSLYETDVMMECNTNMISIDIPTLIGFAKQVASAMSFISSKNVVHRDVAARNVLLTKSMICKIADFGMARFVQKDQEADADEAEYSYQLKNHKSVPVPIKWMALESLLYGKYSSKSDVWSFGIFLWELMTLACAPYPGWNVLNLCYDLENGSRMEKPANCPDKLYGIMLKCWAHNPSNRPTFNDIYTMLS